MTKWGPGLLEALLAGLLVAFVIPNARADEGGVSAAPDTAAVQAGTARAEDAGPAPNAVNAPPPPAEASIGVVETTFARTVPAGGAPPEDRGVVLSESIYANQQTSLTRAETEENNGKRELRLRDRSGRARAHCRGTTPLDCPAGNFCAWGTKPRASTQSVGVSIGGQLVAIDGDASNAESNAVKASCRADSAARAVWFVSVPSGELPRGSIVTATEVDADTQVLKEGTFARTSIFSMDANVVGRTGSTNGSVAAGIGVASMTRSTRAREIEKGPQPNNVSPWVFGARYEVALFEKDWLHRLSIITHYEIVLGQWSLVPGLLLGGGVAFQTSGGSALTAGLLAGGSFHAACRVTPQLTGVIGAESEGLFSNGATLWLNTFYGGPEVSF